MLLPLRLRRLLPALLVTGLLPALVPAASPPAGASSTYLCSGYTSCASAGYSHAGYGTRNNKMYWRMYAGHNCTNYVAYRMIQAGMPNERPWSGSGNATNWGYEMASITDSTPAVGAVAWWKRNVPGAGSAGHVAYVEKVVSSSEIVISEDSWSGDFHWRTVSKEGTGWPSGFIHFVDKAITNKRAPRVTGTPQVGAPLRALTGNWKPAGRYRFQWYADGAAVAGATRATFTPGAAQVERLMRVQVTVSKDGFTSGTAVSAATAPVAEGVIASTTAPTLSGEGMVDEVLTATPGAWSPAPATTLFRWQADGKVIRGQSGRSLTLTRGLVGKRIKVVQVARRDGYAKATAAAARAVGPVVEGVIKVTEPFAASGSNRYGDTLALDGGAVAPRDATVGYTWLRDGDAIKGATTASYRPTASDIGHTVGAKVVASKPRYRTMVRNFAFGTTTTGSTVKATAKPKPHKVVLGIKVRAAGLGMASGPVRVTVGKHQVDGTLADGFVRIMVPGLSPGWRHYDVTYRGASGVEASRTAGKVKVKR